MATAQQQRLLVDTLTERPTAFQVGRVHYSFYPPSLGVYLLSSTLLGELWVDEALLAHNLPAEALRLAQRHRGEVLRLVVLHSLRGYAQIMDEGKVQGRIKHLDKGLSTEELATLLCLLLEGDSYSELVQAYGIDSDMQERQRLREVKEDKHTISLGGRTLYGGLIDYTAERYGWSMDYIMWGISYANLRLLSADASLSIYLSEEELGRLNGKGTRIDGDSITDEQWARIIGED